MTHDSRMTNSFARGKGFNKSSSLVGTPAMTVVHVPTLNMSATKLSFARRIKNRLLDKLKQKNMTPVRFNTDDIQLSSARADVANLHEERRNARLPNNIALAMKMDSGIQDRQWFAIKATREKLTQTSSNLG
jgi:hypothetical protein